MTYISFCPSLKTCERVDTTNTRYSNQTHALIINYFQIHCALRFIINNGLINNLTPLYRHFLTSTIPSNFPMNCLLAFFLYLNCTTKLTLVFHSHYLKECATFFSFLLLSLTKIDCLFFSNRSLRTL